MPGMMQPWTLVLTYLCTSKYVHRNIAGSSYQVQAMQEMTRKNGRRMAWECYTYEYIIRE